MDIFVVMEETWTGEDYNGRDQFMTTLSESHGYFTDFDEVVEYVKGLNLKATPKTHKENETRRKKEYDRALKKHNDHVTASKVLKEEGLEINIGWTPPHPGEFVPKPYVEEYGDTYSWALVEPHD